MPRLKRVDCREPGIRRRRAGKGFYYVDLEGNRIDDEATIARIDALRIPPAWTDVWICTNPRGHIQATGRDAKGRLQYRYHDTWRAHRDREKFEKMLRFAECLPGLRARVQEDLGAQGLTRERVLACAVRLLDLGFFRVGGEEYAEENDSYGLATIQKRHVRIDGDHLVFDYRAKSGKRRVQAVADPDVRAVVAALKQRRRGGADLLAYKADGRWRDVRSSDINDYIKAATGEEFTAKDFRTWSATLLAAVALSVARPANDTKAAQKRAIKRAYDEVARYLGNTPAVARNSYVDPRVVDRFRAGQDVGDVVDLTEDERPEGLVLHGAVEAAVVELLTNRVAG